MKIAKKQIYKWRKLHNFKKIKVREDKIKQEKV